MLCTIIVRRRGFQRLCEKLRAGEARMRLLEALSNRVRASGSRPLSKAALAAFFSLGVLAALCACDVERRRSDAELGLNSQQAAGRGSTIITATAATKLTPPKARRDRD
jgi:hypothetical protein